MFPARSSALGSQIPTAKSKRGGLEDLLRVSGPWKCKDPLGGSRNMLQVQKARYVVFFPGNLYKQTKRLQFSSRFCVVQTDDSLLDCKSVRDARITDL